jgi:hypothetical protein
MHLDPEGVVEVTLDTMRELGFERAALIALDPDGNESGPESVRGDHFDASAAIAEVVGSGEPSSVGDVRAAPVWGDGWLIGVLAGCGSASGSKDLDDLEVLALLASATASGPAERAALRVGAPGRRADGPP